MNAFNVLSNGSRHLRKVLIAKIIPFAIIFLSIPALAQEGNLDTTKTRPHVIGICFGGLDVSIHYDRIVIRKPVAQSYIRCGVGTFYNGFYSGNYINALFVQLFGKKSSHIDLNAGLRVVISGEKEGYSGNDTYVLPDIFVGYRYEKPEGGFIFKLGFSYPTWINIGFGYGF